ncbi:MAG: ubiquinone/menaquinone biosynthesis methyltransferase [Chloroflexota bacterium]
MTVLSGAEKARFVRGMFDAIAARYDLMNRLMTGGRDEAWRRAAAGAVYPEAVRRAIDLGAGTGDLSFALARAAPQARVLSLDFSAEMLRLEAAKSQRLGFTRRVQPVLGDAMAIPAAADSVDAIVTGFTLRNVADVDGVFRECHRALRPGSRLAVLELTPVRTPIFRQLFRLYFHRLVPLLGAMVSGRGYAYRYLPESVLRFPDAECLRTMLQRAGFPDVTYRKLALGTVALHVAQKETEKGRQERGDKEQDARPGSAGAPPASDVAPRNAVASLVDSLPVGRSTPGALIVREIADRDTWNGLLARLPNAHVLQTWEWGAFRYSTGYAARRLVFERAGRPVAAATVLRRPIPFTPWGFAYCPKGPALDYADTELLRQVLATLAEEAKRQRCVFLKVDPDIQWDDRDAVGALRQAGYVPSTNQVQFRSTVLVDLQGDDQTLLSRMSSTWRRYVKKAERDGVVIRQGTDADIPRFYALYRETAERDGFIIRPQEYEVGVWRAMSAGGVAELLLAEVGGQTEAALLALRFGRRAWYLRGASSRAAQKAHAPYLLQWHAMRWARDLGCDMYDMWGAPDDPTDESDATHGLYYFKRGFGGQHVRWVGAYDFVAAPALYGLWNIALPRVLNVLRSLRST